MPIFDILSNKQHGTAQITRISEKFELIRRLEMRTLWAHAPLELTKQL